MIAGGSLYWIRVVKGPYEYIVYDKEQHGDMSGVVVTKREKNLPQRLQGTYQGGYTKRWQHL